MTNGRGEIRIRLRETVPRLRGGRYSAMDGGVPLTSEDEVIAGVGVSGGTTEQDIAIVEAAIDD
jgi:uncharacterized protein GlcG (DUF336 family)